MFRLVHEHIRKCAFSAPVGGWCVCVCIRACLLCLFRVVDDDASYVPVGVKSPTLRPKEVYSG